MKIEVMIYVYIAICVSMIAYNIVYIFILRHREKSLISNAHKYEKIIYKELESICDEKNVDEKHIKYLCKSLKKISGITAFEKALEKLFENHPEKTEKYLAKIYPVFRYLTNEYKNKDTLKIAYFPYILQKYNVLLNDKDGEITKMLFELLRSLNVYCRENTLKAIYSTQKTDAVVAALKIIDTNKTFHHPKLICDGLLAFKGDKQKLKDSLLANFGSYSVMMQLNILNYFRFGNVRCDDAMLNILQDENENRELHYSAIRYFEKFPSDDAKHIIQRFAENQEGLSWEYQAIASSALKSYPDDVTFRILVKNLSNFNWYVRLNSAISCEKLGYTYHDLINVFDGNDRYAREILRYRLERRKTDEKAVKV